MLSPFFFYWVHGNAITFTLLNNNNTGIGHAVKEYIYTYKSKDDNNFNRLINFVL